MGEEGSVGDGSRRQGVRRTATADDKDIGNGERQKPMIEQDEGLTCRQVGPELMVRDVARGRVLFLNRTAAEVWRLSKQTSDSEQIARTIAESHENVDLEVARADVTKCLAELAKLGLLGYALHDVGGGPDNGQQ